jgi:hypothetical protein
MTDVATALCVLYRPGDRVALGHGVRVPGGVLTCLHVLDAGSLDRPGGVRADGAGGRERGAEVAAVLSAVPAADAVLCAALGDGPRSEPVTLAAPPRVGDPVELHYLAGAPGEALAHRTLPCHVRDLVEVTAHAYRSASGTRRILNGVRVLFLDRPVSRGLSGAPVCAARGGGVVGFVHGNAAANGGAAVCLDPTPLLGLLRHVARADSSQLR